jgi:hypothetical protein
VELHPDQAGEGAGLEAQLLIAGAVRLGEDPQQQVLVQVPDRAQREGGIGHKTASSFTALTSGSLSAIQRLLSPDLFENYGQLWCWPANPKQCKQLYNTKITQSWGFLCRVLPANAQLWR